MVVLVELPQAKTKLLKSGDCLPACLLLNSCTESLVPGVLWYCNISEASQLVKIPHQFWNESTLMGSSPLCAEAELQAVADILGASVKVQHSSLNSYVVVCLSGCASIPRCEP
jgi:hypothetical protein